MTGRNSSWSLLVVGILVAGLTVGIVPSASAVGGDPTSVTAAAQGLNLAVTWDAATDADISSYQVTTQPESPVMTVQPNVRSAVLTGVRPNVDYSVSVVAIHGDGSESASDAPDTVRLAAPGGSFTALPPSRILDTRNGTGAPVGPTTAVSLTVAGRGGIPDGDRKSVV